MRLLSKVIHNLFFSQTLILQHVVWQNTMFSRNVITSVPGKDRQYFDFFLSRIEVKAYKTHTPHRQDAQLPIREKQDHINCYM